MRISQVKISAFSFLLLSFLYATDFAPQYLPGPEMQTARMAHEAVVVSGPELLLIGGHGTGFVSLGSVDCFSLSPDSFSNRNMYYVHDNFALARMADGNLLIAGGAADLGVAPGYNNAEIYDPATGYFSAIPQMNYARMNCSAATLSNGSILIVGGWYDNNSSLYGEICDATGIGFTVSGALNTARANPIVLPMNDGNAMIIGGYPPFGGAIIESVELYDTSNNSFTVLQDSLFEGGESGWKPASFDSYHRLMEVQQLQDGRYILLASKVVADSTVYTLFTVDPATKLIAKFGTTAQLPSTQHDYLFAPVVDANLNVAYIGAQKAAADPVQFKMIAVDLNGGQVYNPAEYYTLPENYYLGYAGFHVLNDGRILVSGGHTQTGFNTNFSPHAHTFVVTPNYTTTGMENSTPVTFDLAFNSYPNPFNNRSVLEFTLPSAADIQVDVINALGQTIDRLSGHFSSGQNKMHWNADHYSSGVYFYRLKTPFGVEMTKTLLIK